MTRVNQFAKDLGISRAAALKLLNEARATNDKGKQVVDKFNSAREKAKKSDEKMRKNQKKADQIASDDTNMKLKANKGKSVKITGPKKRPDPEERFQLEGGFDRKAYEKALEREEKLEKYKKEAPKIKAKDGKYVRGMGKACMRDAKEVKIR